MFFRDSYQISEEASGKAKSVHPTSTNRTFFALTEYLRFLEEEEENDTPEFTSTSDLLKSTVDKYLAQLPKRPHFVRQSKSNELNMFTDSHILISVAVSEAVAKRVKVEANVTHLRQAAKALAATLAAQLKSLGGGRVREGDSVHDFVTLYAVRSLDAFHFQNGGWRGRTGDDIGTRAKQDLLNLLAYHASGVGSRFDASELAFVLAVVSRFPSAESDHLLRRAAEIIVDAQARDGSWPTARFVSDRGQGLLHVASFEVALTLTQVVTRAAVGGNHALADQLLPALNRASALVENSFESTGTLSGWRNDHARRSELIESWATAIVLTFLIQYRDVLLERRQRLILRQHDVQWPRPPRTALPWPDLAIALRRPESIPVSVFRTVDPSHKAQLSKALVSQVLNPTVANRFRKPSKSGLLLFGPPGTRKTSIARSISASLEWPMLTISPPAFLKRQGLDGFETEAETIFAELLRLRRVVVLFDECEEFFKRRVPSEHPESRTTGAFITAGMLPRLQSLRDKRWVIFVLATNSSLDELDAAVYRRGRFDFVQEIGYPAEEAQLQYLRFQTKEQKKRPQTLLRIFGETMATLKPGARQSISFTMLDEIVRTYARNGSKGLARSIRSLVKNPIPDRLYGD